MALEMTAGEGFIRGVQPRHLREAGAGGPEMGRVDRAALIVMG